MLRPIWKEPKASCRTERSHERHPAKGATIAACTQEPPKASCQTIVTAPASFLISAGEMYKSQVRSAMATWQRFIDLEQDTYNSPG